MDVVAVDVQVVDRDGSPISTLGRDDFEVTIDGRQRRIVSAAFMTNAQTAPHGVTPLTADAAAGRPVILAVDVASFDAAENVRVMQAARGFVGQLPPSVEVGVVTLAPQGPGLDPTLDRARVRRTLDAVVGQQQQMNGQFNLSSSEIIDIIAESGRQGTVTAMTAQNAAAAATARGAPVPIATDTVLQRVQARECQRSGDLACGEAIMHEARMLAQHLEARAEESLNGIKALLGALRRYPGRKTVVVLSGGIAISDRPGGRIDMGNQAKILGEQAAHANTTIYAVYVDTGFSQAYAAQSRRMRNAVSLERERTLAGKMLDEFAGASGGTMFQDLVGAGDTPLARILRETSAYYLLGVEPASSDRDGRARRLRVKASVRGATVRSRQWVVMRTPAK